MMNWIIGVGSGIGYGTAFFWSARFMYSRNRACAIDDNARSYRMTDPVELFENYDRSLTLSSSVLAAVLWPVTVPAFFLWKFTIPFITGGSAKSQYEIDRERKAQDDRIAQLEKELGILDEPETKTVRHKNAVVTYDKYNNVIEVKEF